MNILGVLSQIWTFITLIPKILELISAIRKANDEVQAQKRARQELEREETMKQNAQKLKSAIEAGDEKATDDALNSIVDDYNRRS